MNLSDILDFISAYSIAIPLLTGMVCYVKLTRPLKIFVAFVLANAIVQIGLSTLSNNAINNHWLINLSALADLIFSLIFINRLYLNFSPKKITSISIALIFIYTLINTIYGWINLVKITFIGAEMLALVLVLAGILHLFKQKENTKPSYFLILIPFSIYLSVSILVFLALGLGLENNNQNLFVFYFYLFPIINILACCSYAVAFYLDARSKLNHRH